VACGCSNFGLDHFPVVDAGVHREILPNQGDQVDVFIMPEVARVLSEEGHQAYSQAHETPGKGVEVQLLWLVWRFISGESLWIPGSVEGAHSSLLNGNMIGMAVSADGVEGQDHLGS